MTTKQIINNDLAPPPQSSTKGASLKTNEPHPWDSGSQSFISTSRSNASVTSHMIGERNGLNGSCKRQACSANIVTEDRRALEYYQAMPEMRPEAPSAMPLYERASRAIVIDRVSSGARTQRPNKEPIQDYTIYVWLTLLFYYLAKYCFPRQYNNGKLVIPGLPYFLKCGKEVQLEEAHLTLYAGKILRGLRGKVTVPKTYCSFERGGIRYIMMEKVKGRDMLDQWKVLSDPQRKKVLATLRSAIECLRTVAPSQKAVTGLKNGPLFNICLPENHGDDDDCIGPFPTITGFHSFILDSHAPTNAYLKDEKAAQEFNQDFIYTQWYTPVTYFSHGDLSPSNVLIDNKGKCAIVDWELAGWWPSYIEHLMCNRYTKTEWEKLGISPDDFVPITEQERTMINRFYTFFQEWL